MKTTILSLLLLLTLAGAAQKSIYNYKIGALNGSVIDFDSLRGKPIVIVNIASGSDRNIQLRQLDTLCTTYAASGLVVVAFPTNDFNKEPKTNEELKNWVVGLHPNLLVTQKTSVKGASISDFYKWCTQKTENGTMDMPVNGDYQKFIINKEGKVVGVYSGMLSPLAGPFSKALISIL